MEKIAGDKLKDTDNHDPRKYGDVVAANVAVGLDFAAQGDSTAVAGKMNLSQFHLGNDTEGPSTGTPGYGSHLMQFWRTPNGRAKMGINADLNIEGDTITKGTITLLKEGRSCKDFYFYSTCLNGVPNPDDKTIKLYHETGYIDTTGDIHTEKDLKVDNDTHILKDLLVDGSAIIKLNTGTHKLQVGTGTTLSSDSTAQEELCVYPKTTIHGTTTLKNILFTKKESNLEGNVTVGIENGTTADLKVYGTTTTKGHLCADHTLIVKGAFTGKEISTFKKNLNVDENLTVTQNANINGNLDITGTSLFKNTVTAREDVTTVKNVDVGMNLNVAQTAHIKGHTVLDKGLTVAENLDVGNKFKVLFATGNTEMNELKATGKATIGTTLDVTNDVTVGTATDGNGTFKITADNGNTEIKGTLNAHKNTDIGGTLDVTGKVQFHDELCVVGKTILQDSLEVTNDTTLSSVLNVTGISHLNNNTNIDGKLTVNGDTELDTLETSALARLKKLEVGEEGLVAKGTATMKNTFTAEEAVVAQKGITCDGDIKCNGKLDIPTKNLNVTSGKITTNELLVTGTTTFNNEFIADQWVWVTGKTTTHILENFGLLTNHGKIDSDEISSSGKIKGLTEICALQILKSEGTLDVAGDAALGSKLTVKELATMEKGLNVTAHANMTVESQAILNNTLTVDGTSTLKSNVTIGTVGSSLVALNIHGNSHTYGHSNLDKKVIIGTNGTVSDPSTILHVKGKADIQGDIHMMADAVLSGNLDVQTGSVSINNGNSLTVTGLAEIWQNSKIHGNLYVGPNDTNLESSKFVVNSGTGNMRCKGDATVEKSVNVNKTLECLDLLVHNNSILSGSLKVTSDTELKNNVIIGLEGQSENNGNLTVNGDSLLKNNMRVHGDTNMEGDVTIGTFEADEQYSVSTILEQANLAVSNNVDIFGELTTLKDSYFGSNMTLMNKAETVAGSGSFEIRRLQNINDEDGDLVFSVDYQSGNMEVHGTSVTKGASLVNNSFTVTGNDGNTPEYKFIVGRGDVYNTVPKFTVSTRTGDVLGKGTLTIEQNSYFQKDVNITEELHVQKLAHFDDDVEMAQDLIVHADTRTHGLYNVSGAINNNGALVNHGHVTFGSHDDDNGITQEVNVRHYGNQNHTGNVTREGWLCQDGNMSVKLPAENRSLDPTDEAYSPSFSVTALTNNSAIPAFQISNNGQMLVTENAQFKKNVIMDGNLLVKGNTTTINTTEFFVKDREIIIGASTHLENATHEDAIDVAKTNNSSICFGRWTDENNNHFNTGSCLKYNTTNGWVFEAGQSGNRNGDVTFNGKLQANNSLSIMASNPTAGATAEGCKLEYHKAVLDANNLVIKPACVVLCDAVNPEHIFAVFYHDPGVHPIPSP